MTKKRLTLEKNEIIEYIEIVEDGVVLFFEDGHSQKFNGEEFVEMINNLYFELKECRETKLFSRRQLEQENEQLKSENRQLKEDNDHKFWKLQFMHQYNKTQLIVHEISRAITQGYEVSDKFQEYLNELKAHNEKGKEKAIEQEKW